MARYQVHMQVGGAFPESDHVHPLTTGELAHQGTTAGQGLAERGRFGFREVGGAAQVAAAVEQQPAQQGRRRRMVAQNPTDAEAGDAIDLPGEGIGLEPTDRAAGSSDVGRRIGKGWGHGTEGAGLRS